MDDKAQEKAYRADTKRERAYQANVDAFIAAGMTTPQGRDFFYWLFDISGLNANPFTANALLTANNCGRMEIGQIVRDRVITQSPENFLVMLKEKSNAGTTDTPDGDSDPDAN